MLQFQLRQVPFYCLLLLVTYLSVLPTVETPDFDHSDKVLHFAAYLGVVAWAYIGFPKASVKLLICIVLWSVGIELVQWQMPSRSFDLLDILANTLGSLAGWQIIKVMQRICPKLA
ncbi:VanZ family protein [Pontibacterium granulatum]|uniref:VanZ family protein n=1 Tax=Pontibacterium granulatum TaxID=2036029 RepID=UPI00249B6D08|nr:VanZ family protein [Pontibacterium granulatum]MDI3324228.1 VanZ family protein [Pontibacterium granulatum]